MTSTRDLIASYADRLERLEAEKDTVAESIAALKEEAKGFGLDVKALARIVAVRRKDKAAEERQYVFNLVAYGQTCGVDVGTGTAIVVEREAAE
jgi:uncharacterized protein (UPF0335 family)